MFRSILVPVDSQGLTSEQELEPEDEADDEAGRERPAEETS